MDFLQQLWIVCPLIFLAGIIDSIAGGGALIALPAYMMTGMPVHSAYGCTKLQSGIGNSVAALRYWKNKCLDFKIAACSALTCVLGTVIGTKIIFLLNDEQLSKLIMLILPLIAIFIIFHKSTFHQGTIENPLDKHHLILALTLGAIIGLYDSIFGAGGGTICMILFAVMLKYDMRVASGNAKIVILTSNFVALIGYIIAGNVVYELALPAAGAHMLGSYIGTGLAVRHGTKFIRPLMFVVILCLFVKLFL